MKELTGHFNTGEITPQIDSRDDTEKYSGGCRQLDNMIPDVFGNAARRPGTELVVAGNGSGCYFEPPEQDLTKIGISTMEELALIGNDAGYPLGGDYELRADLDATGITFWPIGLDSVSFIGTAFNGTFDGRYHTISNLTIGTDITTAGGGADNVGLFHKFNIVTIENLSISNMTVVGDDTIILGCGLLAFQSLGASVVTNVHTQGTITSTGRISSSGGLLGTASPTMNICSSDITISSSGLNISSCGGLVGVFSSNATNCYAQGTIDMLGSPAQGLNNIGGLFGDMTGNDQTIENCYSAVVIQGNIFGAIGKVGGFLGSDSSGTPVYTSNYWDGTIIPVHDLDDIGESGDVAGVLKATSGDGSATDMYKQATYADWDFDTIWTIREDVDYPEFQWQQKPRDCVWLSD